MRIAAASPQLAVPLLFSTAFVHLGLLALYPMLIVHRPGTENLLLSQLVQSASGVDHENNIASDDKSRIRAGWYIATMVALMQMIGGSTLLARYVPGVLGDDAEQGDRQALQGTLFILTLCAWPVRQFIGVIAAKNTSGQLVKRQVHQAIIQILLALPMLLLSSAVQFAVSLSIANIAVLVQELSFSSETRPKILDLLSIKQWQHIWPKIMSHVKNIFGAVAFNEVMYAVLLLVGYTIKPEQRARSFALVVDALSSILWQLLFNEQHSVRLNNAMPTTIKEKLDTIKDITWRSMLGYVLLAGMHAFVLHAGSASDDRLSMSTELVARTMGLLMFPITWSYALSVRLELTRWGKGLLALGPFLPLILVSLCLQMMSQSMSAATAFTTFAASGLLTLVGFWFKTLQFDFKQLIAQSTQPIPVLEARQTASEEHAEAVNEERLSPKQLKYAILASAQLG